MSVKRIVSRVLIGFVLLLAGVYALDYARVRYRMATKHEPFGSVQVSSMYAVRMKNGKTEFMQGDDGPETQVCVNSLFPHMGDPPCWYARKHTRKQIDIR